MKSIKSIVTLFGSTLLLASALLAATPSPPTTPPVTPPVPPTTPAPPTMPAPPKTPITPEPPATEPAPTIPAFDGLVLCTQGTGSLCCSGKALVVEADAAIAVLETAYQCVTKDGKAPVMPIAAESMALTPTKDGVLSFEKVCTKALTEKECPKGQELLFAPVVQITIEQPKESPVLQGIGVVFP